LHVVDGLLHLVPALGREPEVVVHVLLHGLDRLAVAEERFQRQADVVEHARGGVRLVGGLELIELYPVVALVAERDALLEVPLGVLDALLSAGRRGRGRQFLWGSLRMRDRRQKQPSHATQANEPEHSSLLLIGEVGNQLALSALVSWLNRTFFFFFFSL